MQSRVVSDGDYAETTRCHLRLDLMITLHRIINNTKIFVVIDFGQIRSERIKGLIKGLQFLTTTEKAI